MKKVTTDQVFNELVQNQHVEINDAGLWHYWLSFDEDGNFFQNKTDAPYYVSVRAPYLSTLEKELYKKHGGNIETGVKDFWNTVKNTFQSKDCSKFMKVVQQLTDDINEQLERETILCRAKDWYEHISKNDPKKTFEDCIKETEESFYFSQNVRPELENMDLPKLKGTEKQIKWGNEIRQSYIEEEIQSISRHDTPLFHEVAKTRFGGCKKLLTLAEHAGFWIGLQKQNYTVMFQIDHDVADAIKEGKSDAEIQREIYSYAKELKLLEEDAN